MKPSVNKKIDFVRRYRLGEFGNASPTWGHAADFLKDKSRVSMTGLYHLRNKTKGGDTYYDLDRDSLTKLCGSLDVNNYYVSAMAPTPLTIIQGEVCELPELTFTCSKVKKPMRDALAESLVTLKGLSVRMTLKSCMTSKSYEWLWYLLETYPLHTIEFSVYTKNWGTVPGHNTVFWEVRNY